MSRRLLLPLVALVVTVAGVLAFAAWNRSDPRQRLTLTERELTLPWQGQNSEAEEGELRLPIEWERRDGPLEERNWLTEDKLREIGFNLWTPVGAPGAERAYARALPRTGWVVLEYDGPAWREIDRRRQLRIDMPAPRSAREPSRLVAIDAGSNREALARRHGDAQSLILPAVFQLGWLSPEAGGPLVYGYVQRLVVRELTVPRRLSSALADLRTPPPGRSAPPPSPPRPPRFEVDVAVGRSGFPWITDIRRTSP